MSQKTSQSDDQTTVEQYIQQMGPLPVSETMFTYHNKMDDLRVDTERHGRIYIVGAPASNGTFDNSYSPTMKHDPVIAHKTHDVADAVETWLDENPQILERSSAWATYTALKQYSKKFMCEEVHDVFRDRDPDGWK